MVEKLAEEKKGEENVGTDSSLVLNICYNIIKHDLQGKWVKVRIRYGRIGK